MKKYAIVPESNKYHPNILTLMGRGFKWDHAKGLAEWVKNSADAYATMTEVPDSEQFILLRVEVKEPKKDSIFECIDFVGMTADDISKALKVWGDPNASKKGTRKATYGGHGNGGKFYMREMFRSSRFITYRNEALSVFGFNEEKEYGFAQDKSGQLKNRKMDLAKALAFAEIHDLKIPEVVRNRWASQEAGFTVVVGDGPEQFSGRATIEGVFNKLQMHPQARRLIAHKQIICLARGENWGRRLSLPNIVPMAGFEDIPQIDLPEEFVHNSNIFSFRNSKYPNGKLVLRTSAASLRVGEMDDMNSIDIIGELSCLASYRINELGVIRNSRADFIYGECYCPFLEDPDASHVTNEREKLVINEVTYALRAWIVQQIEALADRMALRHQTEQKHRNLEQSSQFVALLDNWKNKFMFKLTSTLLGGTSTGDTFGGSGSSAGGLSEGPGLNSSKENHPNSPERVINEGDKGNKGGDNGGGTGGGSGTEQRRGPKMPRVLLSGHDLDPLDPNSTNPFNCDERHPPVHQRDQDIAEGIFWINTSRPLAVKIIERDGVNSVRWREYLFQRFVEIILKQQIHQMGKTHLQLTADGIDNLMDRVISMVHDQASKDLEAFLFEDSLNGAHLLNPPIQTQGLVDNIISSSEQ